MMLNKRGIFRVLVGIDDQRLMPLKEFVISFLIQAGGIQNEGRFHAFGWRTDVATYAFSALTSEPRTGFQGKILTGSEFLRFSDASYDALDVYFFSPRNACCMALCDLRL